MIPILFDRTDTDFGGNGICRLRDCISCTVTEERNSGLYECEFEYPVNGINYDLIDCGRIILVDHDDTGDKQAFDIISRTNAINGVVTFHAVHISYRLNKITANPKYITSLASAINAIQDTTPANQFNYSADFQADGYLPVADGVPKTVRSIIGGSEGSMLDTYGGEILWDGWNVKFLTSRGVDRDFTIRYGVNMTGYNEDIDFSGTYNEAIPYWTDGTKIVIGDVIKLTDTSYAGREECVPLDLSDRFSSRPTKGEVETYGRMVLRAKYPIMPEQTIKVEFVRLSDSPEYENLKNLQKCELCDTVQVVFPMYNLSGRFKIVKTEYNVLLDRYDSMELGTLSTTLSQALGIQQGSDGTTATPQLDAGITASAVTVNNGAAATIDAPFNAEFVVAPVVTGILYDVQDNNGASTNTHQCVLQLKSTSTTGASFNVRNNGSAARRVRVAWVAVG